MARLILPDKNSLIFTFFPIILQLSYNPQENLKKFHPQVFIVSYLLKDTKKLKELEIMRSNAIHICISWYNKIC